MGLACSVLNAHFGPTSGGKNDDEEHCFLKKFGFSANTAEFECEQNLSQSTFRMLTDL